MRIVVRNPRPRQQSVSPVYHVKSPDTSFRPRRSAGHVIERYVDERTYRDSYR